MAAAGKMRPSLFGYRLPRIHQTQAKTKMRRVKPKQFIFGGGGGVYAVSRFMAGRECALFFLVVCCCFAGFGKWCIFLCVLGGEERERKRREGSALPPSPSLSLPPNNDAERKSFGSTCDAQTETCKKKKKKEKRKQKKFGGIARRT